MYHLERSINMYWAFLHSRFLNQLTIRHCKAIANRIAMRCQKLTILGFLALAIAVHAKTPANCNETPYDDDTICADVCHVPMLLAKNYRVCCLKYSISPPVSHHLFFFSSILLQCNDGYVVTANGQCAKCGSGPTCTGCKAANPKICTGCDIYYGLVKAKCVKCSAGCWNCDGNPAKCTRCADGYTLLKTGKCQKCEWCQRVALVMTVRTGAQ